MKPQLPRIVVNPPSRTVFVSKMKKSSGSSCQKSAALPKKLVLSPDFWSNSPTKIQKARKKKISFLCRNDECQDKFTSTREREVHEKHCLSYHQVKILICHILYENNHLLFLAVRISH